MAFQRTATLQMHDSTASRDSARLMTVPSSFGSPDMKPMRRTTENLALNSLDEDGTQGMRAMFKPKILVGGLDKQEFIE